MLYEDIQMSGSLDITGSFVVPIGTTASAGEYTGSLVYDSTDKKLYVWSGSWGIVGAQSYPESAPNTVFTDIPANLTASVSIGTNLISMSLTEADDLLSTPYSASISGSSFEIIFTNADSSSGFIRNTTTLSTGTYYYNVTVFDSGSINSQSYSDQTVTVAASPAYDIEYLVVAGGGASDLGGGAGAGGYLSSSLSSIESGTSITVTVGAGGAGSTNSAGRRGNNGQDSSIASSAGTSFTTVTSIGGGAGSTGNDADKSGGDGGSGGGVRYYDYLADGSRAPGSGTVGQGNDGGSATYAHYVSGGGGGAGAAGESTTTNDSGDGGIGRQSSITGTATYYAGGGGGGGGYSGTSTGNGGSGGGGNANGGSAGANTGGGGAGGGVNSSAGNGGSGVVILRIPTSNYTGTTTGSPTVTTDGSDTVIKFTSSGTYTA